MKSSWWFAFVGAIALLAEQSSSAFDARAAAARPRVIVTTDGEVDDRCSMVRFLLYANEWEVEGLIYSSSKYHWKGHKWDGESWIERDVDLYGQTYETLKQHAAGYPTPQQLKEVIFVGNIDNVGEMEKETPGSNRIVQVLLDNKPGPVYLQAWGGANTIARALKSIEEKHSAEMPRVSRKGILYLIHDQDPTLREYVLKHWPEMMILQSVRQFRSLGYDWAARMPAETAAYFRGPWMREHILSDHGPLCARYEAHRKPQARKETAYEKDDFRSEGDSPAFMHQIDVGLRSLEHPGHGGWGGRFIKADQRGPSVWQDDADDGNPFKPIWRWSVAFQNDWAARADWCVRDYKSANHPPVVTLAHAAILTARPGQKVSLQVHCEDPDADAITCRWWHYKDAGSYPSLIEIRDAAETNASFITPANSKPGNTVHMICEVTDHGTPPLTRYERVIVTVAGNE